jgi:transposase
MVPIWTFPNNPNGHWALIIWLQKVKSPVRVSLEATGIYSLDLSFALDAAEGIEVAVLNPKVANRFAQTIRRSKTDAADAEVLAEYTHRMPFTAWIAPSSSSMRLRSTVSLHRYANEAYASATLRARPVVHTCPSRARGPRE